MTTPCDTQEIEERIQVFAERFGELTARYDEFGKTLNQIHDRIASHVEYGEQALEIAREAQDYTLGKTGVAKLLAKRNQGRINAKLLGSMERNFAVLKDLQVLSARNLELITDTGVAVKRDLRELMESVVHTIRDFHRGTSNSLSLLSVDIEMLKELSAQRTLKTSKPDPDCPQA